MLQEYNNRIPEDMVDADEERPKKGKSKDQKKCQPRVCNYIDLQKIWHNADEVWGKK